MEPQLKISRAVTRLVMSHPFFGSMALGLHFKQNEDLTPPTMATDGKHVWWHPEFVDDTIEEEVTGVIAHEVMHVVLKHMLRMGNRDPKRWNFAADYAINGILIEAGFKLPKGALYNPKFDGMTAERIYDMLEDDDMLDGAAEFGQVLQATGGDGSPMPADEAAQMSADIDAKITMAANAAKAIGNLPSAIKGLIEEMERSQVDWVSHVRRVAGGDQPDNYSFRHINKRMYHSHRIVSPGIEKVGAGDIIIGVDSSGSVSDTALKHFLGELNALSEDLQPRSITVITCDSTIEDVRHYNQGEVITAMSSNGRGGTRVTPVFDYVRDHNLPCDKLIYLTDLEVGDFQDTPPPYQVLWVSCSTRSKPAPWGEPTYINI